MLFFFRAAKKGMPGGTRTPLPISTILTGSTQSAQHECPDHNPERFLLKNSAIAEL